MPPRAALVIRLIEWQDHGQGGYRLPELDHSHQHWRSGTRRQQVLQYSKRIAESRRWHPGRPHDYPSEHRPVSCIRAFFPLCSEVTYLYLRYYVVTNAARRAEDLAWISQQLEEFNKQHNTDVSLRVIEDKALVALQGPTAAETLQALIPQVDLQKLYFGQSLNTTITDSICHVARCGYTGEDGFEVRRALPAGIGSLYHG